MKIITVILALAKIFSLLDKWITKLTLEHHKRKVEENDAAFMAAIDEAYQKKSTKDLQSELGKYLD